MSSSDDKDVDLVLAVPEKARMRSGSHAVQEPIDSFCFLQSQSNRCLLLEHCSLSFCFFLFPFKAAANKTIPGTRRV